MANGNAVTKREAERPLTPREQLRSELARFAPSFEKVLPKHLTPDRIVTLTLVAATKTPKLFDCTPESIALAVMRIAQWGLDIGTTAHLVPFRDQCTPVPDWKGLVELVRRSGQIRDVRARCVYANEHFVHKDGAQPVLEHHPMLGEGRGKLIGAYAVAVDFRGAPTWEVMSFDEIDAIRKAAERSKPSDAWKNHYDEMAKKTVIKRLCKRLPQTPALVDALAGDDGEEGGLGLRTRAKVATMQELAPHATLGPALAGQLSAGDYYEQGQTATTVAPVEVVDRETGEIMDAPPADGSLLPPEAGTRQAGRRNDAIRDGRR